MSIIIVLVVILVIGGIVANFIGKKPEKSIDLQETLLPKTDIHAEIAKVAEEFKAHTIVVAETPTITKVIEAKPKRPAKTSTPKKEPVESKQSATKKPVTKKPAAPKTKATPKKGK